MAAERRVLVGRERELAALDAYLDRLVSHSASLLIRGEPGIGKTSLWEAGVDGATAHGARVLAARPAEAERALSFAALGDLLTPVGDAIDELPPPQRRALRVALLLEEPEAHPDRRAVGAAFLSCLRALAEHAPLVVAVDDLQWVDPPSASALEFAFRRLADEHVSLLATLRIAPEERRSLELERASGDRVTRLTPGPLSVGALYALVQSRLGLSLSRPTLLRLHEAVRGNPFFALELARGFAESGGDPAPGEPLPVPRDLRDVVRARLADQPASVAETLLYAAALSRPTVALLDDALGNDGRGERGVALAADAGLLEVDGPRIRFSHPLLASIHYSATAPAKRREAHRRLAGVVDDPEERARHLASAIAGPDADVASALERAAIRAKRRGAIVTAADLAEQALERTPTGFRDAHRRSLAAADYRYASGDVRRALALLDDALRDSEPGAERAEVLWTRGKIVFEADHTNAGLDLFHQALSEVGHHDESLRARILVNVSFVGAGGAKTFQAARPYAREAVEIARRTGDTATLAHALARLAGLKYNSGEGLDTALFEEAVALEESVGGLELDFGPTSLYAEALYYAGDFARARTLLERLCDRGRQSGDAALHNSLFRLAAVEFAAGRWARAADLAVEAHDLAVQSGRRAAEARGMFVLARVKGALGEVDEARALAEAALVITDSRGWKSGGPRGALGLLELSLENYEAAHEVLMPVIERYRSLGVPVIDQAFDAIEALAALGRVPEGYELLPPESAARPLGDSMAAGVKRARGQLELAAGDLRAAEATLSDAVAAWEREQAPFELARTRLDLGTARRRAGRKRAARETLERALATFEELGARIWAERARRELARIGGRSAPRAELSGTEAEIAALVGEGRSNREVAEALHLSPKTVEWNLSKIYRKLGVRSRAELAARR